MINMQYIIEKQDSETNLKLHIFLPLLIQYSFNNFLCPRSTHANVKLH